MNRYFPVYIINRIPKGRLNIPRGYSNAQIQNQLTMTLLKTKTRKHENRTQNTKHDVTNDGATRALPKKLEVILLAPEGLSEKMNNIVTEQSTYLKKKIKEI